MKNFRWPSCLLVALLAVSCMTPRKMEIFRGMEYGERYAFTQPEELRLQPFDRLNILVLSEIPQLAAPFNATLNFEESAQSSARQTVSYVVDREGCIEFPKLGPVNVQGLTTKELGEMLSTEIKQRGYINDATVLVTLEKFEITVVGERNEQMEIDGGINLIQLLARTGGPATSFRMNDVMVLRTENGARVPYQVDLRNKEVFNSPVFYLQQNDIVYFKPRNPKVDPALQGILVPITSVLSGVSVITSVLVLVRLSK